MQRDIQNREVEEKMTTQYRKTEVNTIDFNQPGLTCVLTRTEKLLLEHTHYDDDD